MDPSSEFGNKDVLNLEELLAYMNDKIAIIGADGSGKSTLLKIITGKFEDFQGTVQPETDFNYFAQIDIPDKQMEKANKMSGGDKIREKDTVKKQAFKAAESIEKESYECFACGEGAGCYGSVYNCHVQELNTFFKRVQFF